MDDKTTSNHSHQPPAEPNFEELEKMAQKIASDFVVSTNRLHEQMKGAALKGRLTKARVRQARQALSDVSKALSELLKQ